MEHLVRILNEKAGVEFIKKSDGFVVSVQIFGDDVFQIEQSISLEMKRDDAEYLADFLKNRSLKLDDKLGCE